MLLHEEGVSSEETIIGHRTRRTVAGDKIFRERTTDKLGGDGVPVEDTVVHAALDDVGNPATVVEHMVKTDCCGKTMRVDVTQPCPSCHRLHICSNHMTRRHVCLACFWKDLAKEAGYWAGWACKWLVVISLAIVAGILAGIFSSKKKPHDDHERRA